MTRACVIANTDHDTSPLETPVAVTVALHCALRTVVRAFVPQALGPWW